MGVRRTVDMDGYPAKKKDSKKIEAYKLQIDGLRKQIDIERGIHEKELNNVHRVWLTAYIVTIVIYIAIVAMIERGA